MSDVPVLNSTPSHVCRECRYFFGGIDLFLCKHPSVLTPVKGEYSDCSTIRKRYPVHCPCYVARRSLVRWIWDILFSGRGKQDCNELKSVQADCTELGGRDESNGAI